MQHCKISLNKKSTTNIKRPTCGSKWESFACTWSWCHFSPGTSSATSSCAKRCATAGCQWLSRSCWVHLPALCWRERYAPSNRLPSISQWWTASEAICRQFSRLACPPPCIELLGLASMPHGHRNAGTTTCVTHSSAKTVIFCFSCLF